MCRDENDGKSREEWGALLREVADLRIQLEKVS